MEIPEAQVLMPVLTDAAMKICTNNPIMCSIPQV